MNHLPAQPARLEFNQVSIAYHDAVALKDLTFQVPHGAQVAIVGPNGAGKSTLFKALVGLLPLRSGEICIHGSPLGRHTDCVAYIPQREDVDWRFPVTVQDVVMMGRYGRRGWLRRPTSSDRLVVFSALEKMGIAGLAGKPIGSLSGGQQQRVFLARALAQEPHILLLDEPFNGVDAPTQEITLALLDQLRLEQVTIMVSTHDLNLAARNFEYVLLINRRLISYGFPDDVFNQENMRAAFGDQMFMLQADASSPLATVVDQCCGHGEEE